MSGMTDVIAAHQLKFESMGGWEDDSHWLECSCRDSIDNEDDRWTGDSAAEHAAHVAEELTKAGFGKLWEAKVEALREAADDLAGLPYVHPDAQGRSEYLRVLAVRRGSADKWLRERADGIEGAELVQAIHDREQT